MVNRDVLYVMKEKGIFLSTMKGEKCSLCEEDFLYNWKEKDFLWIKKECMIYR